MVKIQFIDRTVKGIKSVSFKNGYRRVVRVIRYRPILSFFAVLLLLLLLIILGNVLTPTAKQSEAKQKQKNVSIYKIGSAPRVSVTAKIEKSGVVKINSLTAGVVQAINVSEGEKVGQGTNLVTLASNYEGGNTFSIQTQIAKQQLDNMNNTFQEQKDLVNNQRDLANKQLDNSTALQNISNQSIGETQALLNLDQSILNTLNQNLSNYQASNSAGINNNLILTTQETQSQYQATINGLNDSLRNLQLQAGNDKPPAEIANIQKDITLKQLDIQDKSLDLNKEITQLQYNLAVVNEETMHPVSPFPGTIQRIYVREGESVNPGTPLMTISGNGKSVTAVATVPGSIAKNISEIESSNLQFGKKSYLEKPAFIATEATDNQLYPIIFSVPDQFTSTVGDGEYIQIALPIGYADTSSTIPFVPLDAVYQSQDHAYLFVNDHGKVKAKTVGLGSVYGRFVQITSGLQSGDQVITDRNVVEGDLVDTANSI